MVLTTRATVPKAFNVTPEKLENEKFAVVPAIGETIPVNMSTWLTRFVSESTYRK